MKSLLKIILILGLAFASTFVIAKATGFLNVEQLTGWVIDSKENATAPVGLLISLLLAADLFIAVPTLSLNILSGYLLGFVPGALYAFAGMLTAGVLGSGISRLVGDKLLKFILRDEADRRSATEQFNRYGFVMILLARAVPILPEVTACLAGITKMPFWKFLLAWLLNSIPYAFLASYAGSISTLENPKPMLFTAMAISGLLWLGWFLLQKKIKKLHQSN